MGEARHAPDLTVPRILQKRADGFNVNNPEYRRLHARICTALQISKVTLWRLEMRGLVTPLGYSRHKRYSVDRINRLAAFALGAPAAPTKRATTTGKPIQTMLFDEKPGM